MLRINSFRIQVAKILGIFGLETAVLTGLISNAEATYFSDPINTGNIGKIGVTAGDIDPAFTWNYTGNFEDTRYKTYVVNDYLSWIMNKGDVNSNNNYGSDVPLSMQPFQGVAYMYHNFEIPENATNIKLNFSAIAADDRVVVSLNGTELFATVFSLPAYTSTSGLMMDSNGNYVSKNINGNGWEGSFIVDNPNLFKVGEENVLRFWINNTFNPDPNAPAIPLQGPPDGAVTDFRGIISYDVTEHKSVPEPSSVLSLLAFGGFGLSKLRKRQEQKETN